MSSVFLTRMPLVIIHTSWSFTMAFCSFCYHYSMKNQKEKRFFRFFRKFIILEPLYTRRIHFLCEVHNNFSDICTICAKIARLARRLLRKKSRGRAAPASCALCESLGERLTAARPDQRSAAGSFPSRDRGRLSIFRKYAPSVSKLRLLYNFLS